MHRFHRGYVSTAAAALLAFGATANAQSVERSGNVYHKAVCAPAAFGSARCLARVVTDKAGRLIVSPDGGVTGYTPQDLRDAYKVKGKGSSSTIIVIVAAYGYSRASSDLFKYRSYFGLPACTIANGCFKRLNQRGQASGYPAQNLGWAQEQAVDVDMASAMCPNCKIYLIEADSPSLSDFAAAENTAASLNPHVISNSYAGDEAGTQSYEPAYKHLGIAITAGSGDQGYAAGPQFPAASPHVIAVGGTHLVRSQTARGWSETVWSGAGSGCSVVYAKPVWQKDPSCKKRMIADVSAVADPANAVAIYGPVSLSLPGWLLFGGTSVATPVIAGLYGVKGTGVYYGRDIYWHKGNLFDVTHGSNGSCGGSYYCTGRTGYDGPTGLGAPDSEMAFGKDD